MTILSTVNLKKSFGIRTVFEDLSFKIDDKDKVGILGINGAGKTTLFKLITGELEPESGIISREKGLSVAYMQQNSDYTSNKTAYEEVLSIFSSLTQKEEEISKINLLLENKPDLDLIKRQHLLSESYAAEGGLVYKSKIRSALIGLGFSEAEIHLPFCDLSGGQRTRVLLAKILLSDSRLLLLDEPTNHLDIASTRWLEEFLIEYKGAVLLISHDRFFLDRTTNRTFELENTHLTLYSGNYTYFKEKKAFDRLTLERDYRQKQKEIKRIEEIIEQQKRFGRERNFITIKSKQKQIERIEETVKEPEKEPDELDFKFKACEGIGNDALIIKNLSKAFEQKKLFHSVNMLIKGHERIFITGPNGCGKTTLFKIIMKEVSPESGEVIYGARAKIGYYDQTISTLTETNTVFGEISDLYPYMSNTQIRSALGAFLFKGDDVFKQVSMLSGGERARVAMLKLLLSQTNFLLLDEPTNHLDIPSKEALEDALLEYDGTLLVISHDRYFINKLADRIYDLTADGVDEYKGNYDFYLEQSEKRLQPQLEKKADKPNVYLQKKADESEKRKHFTRIRKIEEESERIEEEINALNDSLLSTNDYKKILEITEEIQKKKQTLDLLLEEWETLYEN